MRNITYGSVCSGIEAATVAWHPLGLRAAWCAEIEPFPSAVLAHHCPDMLNNRRLYPTGRAGGGRRDRRARATGGRMTSAPKPMGSSLRQKLDSPHSAI